MTKARKLPDSFRALPATKITFTILRTPALTPKGDESEPDGTGFKSRGLG
ncbi:hypothetical protein [Methylobacterium sp. 1030]